MRLDTLIFKYGGKFYLMKQVTKESRKTGDDYCVANGCDLAIAHTGGECSVKGQPCEKIEQAFGLEPITVYFKEVV